MRRPILFSIAFGLGLAGSLNARAQGYAESHIKTAPPAGQTVIEPTEVARQALDRQVLVDRMAADFFESSLRHSQAQRVQAATADAYQAMTPEQRAEFREQRRAAWRAMSENQRRSLRNTKTPSYLSLSEEQKRPFRDIALDQLTASGARRAIDPTQGGI